MTGPLAPIFPELERLIPRLGSGYDGEALGAAHEIRRVLAGAGLNYNDLVAALRRDAGIVDPVPKPSPIKTDPSYRDALREMAMTVLESRSSTESERRCAASAMHHLNCGERLPTTKADRLRSAYRRLIRGATR